MKALLVTAAVGAVGIATSMADPVYSANVVGFVNLDLHAGYNLISNPLQATNNTVAAIFPTLPNGTQLIQWDPALQTYKSAVLFDMDVVGGWEAPDTIIQPGEGFFLQVLDATTVTFVGEVRQGNLSTPVTAAYSFLGSQIPMAGLLSTDFSYVPSNGDQVITWNANLQTYNSAVLYDLDVVGGWEVEPNLAIGQGFILQRGVGAGATTWTKSFSVQ